MLNNVGDCCMNEEMVSKALEAYGLAGNNVMVEFIKSNFHD